MFVYSIYDLNKDRKVNSLDLAIALLYAEIINTDPKWDSYSKVNDLKGNPICASMCDFNNDGVVNMLDLVALMLNYN